MAKKKNAYLCHCDYECSSREGMLAHMRREHPDDGYSAWDMLGDLGDKFANSAMRELDRRLREQSADLQRRLDVAEPKAKSLDELVPRFKVLGRALRITHEAVQTAFDNEDQLAKK